MENDISETRREKQTPSKTPRVSRQFWQAGEFLPENNIFNTEKNEQPGLDHARLHPRFLHSNATSHKWALGAMVELLDNSMDEVSAGCTYVIVDTVDHPLNGGENPMLLVEDDGGGMNPSTIRNCMSFGFSLKQGKKMIGQYGNGFKTSTMRLGADAMVLTKSASAKTCSVGLLSYTFLTETNSQDVTVPIVDYNLDDHTRRTRGDAKEWNSKLEMICKWGPFASEDEIWEKLDSMPLQGTRVYIWNLWQTSDDFPELDFLTDPFDICLRGHDDETQETTGRKKRIDEGMKRCHSYRHSLRSYVSMLYLQWPKDFKIIVRGKEVIPVPVTSGMKHVAVYEYRPRSLPKEEPITSETKGPVVVPVYVGFAVEAPDTSVSGFCVYHRNRLIKPFWKVYTSASSVGRGVIGFLQVDFVEPAHDKQDFENTPPLQKLEKYLKRQVPQYWRAKAHLVGYQDHLSMTKSEPICEQPLSTKEHLSVGVEPNENCSEIPMEAEALDEGHHSRTPSKTKVTLNLSTGDSQTISFATDDLKVRTQPKSPSKCFQEMQHQVAQLQQSVQEFCNGYGIKEEAQLVLGRVFGTAMSRVIDPARELKKMCTSQTKGHRQALLFIAKSKSEGNLQGPIPQLIKTEMKAMGLDLCDRFHFDFEQEQPSLENDQIQKTFDLTEDVLEDEESEGKRKLEVTDTPDTVDDEMRESCSLQMPPYQDSCLAVPVRLDATTVRWIQSAPIIETEPQSFSFEITPSRTADLGLISMNGHNTDQDLEQLGLSVVEKFLRTKPSKFDVVQLAPCSRDIDPSKRMSKSIEAPQEVVNLSEQVDLVESRTKRHKCNSKDPSEEQTSTNPTS